MQPRDLTPSPERSISAILKEAWQKTDGIKAQINTGCIVAFLFIGCVFGLHYLLEPIVRPYLTFNLSKILAILIEFPFAFIFVALLKIALENCLNNEKLSFYQALKFCLSKIESIFGFYFILCFPDLLFSNISSAKLEAIAPSSFSSYFSLYFIAFIPILPIIILIYTDILARNISVEKAIWENLQPRLSGWWLEIIGLLLILLTTYIASALLLFIPLIWLVPLSYTVSAILYREVYGIKRVDTENEISAKK